MALLVIWILSVISALDVDESAEADEAVLGEGAGMESLISPLDDTDGGLNGSFSVIWGLSVIWMADKSAGAVKAMLGKVKESWPAPLYDVEGGIKGALSVIPVIEQSAWAVLDEGTASLDGLLSM